MQGLTWTCWRGIEIAHPPQWELAVASGIDEPGRCAFCDRAYHRMDVRWKPLKYVPDLELILTKYRQQGGKAVMVQEALDLPQPWQGIVVRSGDWMILHAVRFFREPRCLVEATLVWPEGRDVELERVLLESVRFEDASKTTRLWQGMGLRVTLDREFDLYRSDAKVGRVEWLFRTKAKTSPLLQIERIAMPNVWLTDPLRDWLIEQLPENHCPVRQEMTPCNSHRGEALISKAPAGTLASLRGIRKVRLDVAWQCPTENRLYRISLSKLTRQEEVTLPRGLAVHCCGPVPTP